MVRKIRACIMFNAYISLYKTQWVRAVAREISAYIRFNAYISLYKTQWVRAVAREISAYIAVQKAWNSVVMLPLCMSESSHQYKKKMTSSIGKRGTSESILRCPATSKHVHKITTRKYFVHIVCYSMKLSDLTQPQPSVYNC